VARVLPCWLGIVCSVSLAESHVMVAQKQNPNINGKCNHNGPLRTRGMTPPVSSICKRGPSFPCGSVLEPNTISHVAT